MVDIDIDIWGYGRDAGQAGRFTTASLKASYPFVEVPSSWLKPYDKIIDLLKEHFPRNHNDQLVYMTWLSQTPAYIFFQDREDADLCRALFYVY